MHATTPSAATTFGGQVRKRVVIETERGANTMNAAVSMYNTRTGRALHWPGGTPLGGARTGPDAAAPGAVPDFVSPRGARGTCHSGRRLPLLRERDIGNVADTEQAIGAHLADPRGRRLSTPSAGGL